MSHVIERKQEMTAEGMRGIGAELRNKDGYPINPATDDTLEELKLLTDGTINNTLTGMLKELKKINLHLESMTDERIENTDVEG